MLPLRTSGPELCTETEVTDLVHTFYAKVRKDEILGPIFESNVDNWDRHLAKLVDFWSSTLRRTGRFVGAPMPKHAALPGLSAALFYRWLQLFRENAATQSNQLMTEQACAIAERIAQSLWMGYQITRDPYSMPTALANG